MMFRQSLVVSRNVTRVLYGSRNIKLVQPMLSSYVSSYRHASTDRSKLESTLKMLREDAQRQFDEDERRLKLVPVNGDVVVKKSTLKEKIIHELKHYYNGFRLLALETKLSAKYLWRVLRGATLSRRERQQLVRTVSDLFRLVPFSIFIIVPFMELALPIFIKLFPNMLPSTFQESSKEEEKLRKQVKVKVEMAKFLQDTIEEIALEKKANSSGATDSKALEFARFIKKVRSEGGYVSNEELLKFSKLFEDELTLDNLGMGQLRALCRLLAIQTLGSPEILRFQLNMKLRELKADDKQIAAEGGVEALNSLDLQQACRARGMRSIGLSEERLRQQLKQWLELSLNDKVPPSFLLLTRTLYLPEDISFTDRLKALVQTLPEGISEQTKQKLTEMEGGKVDHAERLGLIKKIEDAIAKEKQLEKEARKKLKEQQKKTEEAKAQGIEETKDITPTMTSVSAQLAKATEKLQDSIKDVKVLVEQQTKKIDKPEEIKLDPKDLSSIEQVLVGGPIHEAKNDLIDLKEKAIEHSEDLIEINSIDKAFAETKVAKRLRSKLNTMIEHVDNLVTQLEEEKRNVDEVIADPAVPEEVKLKNEKKIRIQDLIDKLSALKDSDEDRKTRIIDLLKSLDEDKDGIIDGKFVLEVIDILEKHNNVPISAAQLASMVETLKKEDQVAAAQKVMGNAVFDAPMTATATDMDIPNVPPTEKKEQKEAKQHESKTPISPFISQQPPSQQPKAPLNK